MENYIEITSLSQFKRWINSNQDKITVTKTISCFPNDQSINIPRKISKVQTNGLWIFKEEFPTDNPTTCWFPYPKASEITFSKLTEFKGIRTVIRVHDKIMEHHWKIKEI